MAIRPACAAPPGCGGRRGRRLTYFEAEPAFAMTRLCLLRAAGEGGATRAARRDGWGAFREKTPPVCSALLRSHPPLLRMGGIGAFSSIACSYRLLGPRRAGESVTKGPTFQSNIPKIRQCPLP